MPSPFRLFTRRAGPLGLALTAYDIWRRLPPKQRQRLIAGARTHGPRLASEAMRRRRARKNRGGPKP